MWTKPLPEPLCERHRQVIVVRRIEPVIPHEHVQALDFLDQKDDRAASRGHLEARILLETRTPSPQLLELVRLEPSLLHRPTILRAARSRTCSGGARRRAYARVEPAVQDVDDQVQHHDRERKEENAARSKWEITLLRAPTQHSAEPR